MWRIISRIISNIIFALIFVMIFIGLMAWSMGLLRAHELKEGARHVNYNNWVNKAGKGCCNHLDCEPVPEAEEKTIDGKLHVYVRGLGPAAGKNEWCPVLWHHYLSRGNAANWETSHRCVWHQAGTTPCEQFICFQPKPQF